MKCYKNNRNLRMVSCEITSEPLNNNYPPEALEHMEKIYALISKKPKKAIEECLTAINLYPDVPIFYNNLCGAYQALNDIENMNKYICEAYKRFPDYLFAKCAYANLKLATGDFAEIPVIFGGSYCLKDIYPSRNIFHIQELITLHFTMGKYFIKIGDIESAKVYLDVLEHIVPEHEATQRLREELMVEYLAHSIFTGKNIKRRKSQHTN